MNIEKSIVIKGIVVAAAWESDGQVSAVEIAAFDEKRYRVANDRQGRGLLKCMQKVVTVHGRLDSEGERDLVYVDRFRLDVKETPCTNSG